MLRNQRKNTHVCLLLEDTQETKLTLVPSFRTMYTAALAAEDRKNIMMKTHCNQI